MRLVFAVVSVMSCGGREKVISMVFVLESDKKDPSPTLRDTK
jgi:hypothetical protein